jgi:putative transposase
MKPLVRLAPPFPAQQRAFDLFRREYNHERPHEALAQRPPASAFTLSPRRYPRPLLRFPVDAPWYQAARIARNGCIRWDGIPLFISAALAHEDVELRYESEIEQWHVLFGPLSLGWIRQTPTLRFTPTKGRMADLVEKELSQKLSGMSSD